MDFDLRLPFNDRHLTRGVVNLAEVILTYCISFLLKERLLCISWKK